MTHFEQPARNRPETVVRIGTRSFDDILDALPPESRFTSLSHPRFNLALDTMYGRVTLIRGRDE